MSRMEWQRQSAEDHEVRQMMRTQVLEARAQIDTVKDAGSSCFSNTLKLNEMVLDALTPDSKEKKKKDASLLEIPLLFIRLCGELNGRLAINWVGMAPMRLETLETHMSRMEWQRQRAEDDAVRQMMRIHVLEARAQIDTVEDTDSSC
ncbi:hypothetical protein Tco_0060940 [Tanacetum coccineum]